jgi:3-phosphoshikimate 1-carboxyvinyltransferase
MGARLNRTQRGELLDVSSSSSELTGTEIHSSEIPSVDEVPILAIAAAAASGITRFVDVGELRIKESDRFAISLELAQGLGARAWGEGDDLVIEGLGGADRFAPLEIDAHGDHRVAMAAAIAGFVGAGATISGFDAVATSFPGFLQELEGLR